MEQIYHYTGLIIFWFIAGSLSVFASVFLPMLFWGLNDRYYTWLYQTVELIKVYFRYRNKKFEDKEFLLTVQKNVLNSKTKRIYKKWHLNFIDKKLKQMDNAA